MSLHSATPRRSHENALPRDARRALRDPSEALPADDGAAAPRSMSPDVLELLLLHGDCAFLLDLREL